MQDSANLTYTQTDEVLCLSFNHPKSQNPFSRALTKELISIQEDINRDEKIKAIIITGGENRSFSVGGDFKDVSVLNEKEHIQKLLTRNY